ncbi:unnamed protein product [Arctogadus glacialis]
MLRGHQQAGNSRHHPPATAPADLPRQLTVLEPVWMLEWRLKYSLDAKHFQQASHMKGFSPARRKTTAGEMFNSFLTQRHAG